MKGEKRMQKNQRFLGIIILLFGLLLSSTACQKNTSAKTQGLDQRENPAPALDSEAILLIRTITIKREKSTHSLSTTGSILAIKEAAIGPKIAGLVEKIFVDEGDEVKKGDILLQLDKTNLILAVNQAEAAVEVAQANLAQAKTNLENTRRDFERLSKLYQKKVITQEKYDQMDSSFKIAQDKVVAATAQINQTKENLNLASQQLKDSTVFSPFSAIVVERRSNEGEMVTPGDKVLHLMDISRIKVEGEFPERDLAMIKAGMQVKVSLDAYPGQVFQGHLELVGPTVDMVSRTFKVRAVLDNQERLLKAGMFARMELCLPEEEALFIPGEALIREVSGEAHVFVVKDGLARKRRLEIGRRSNQLIEVIQGLTEGEEVVITGQDKLVDGRKIRIVKEETPADTGNGAADTQTHDQEETKALKMNNKATDPKASHKNIDTEARA